ncbi:MAG: YidC/Oxa1 family membrane protein insertase [Candidatus Gracilibacteria bacterium]|nr:YidC/Oxa1 family membrane protein insertase [Candidatus Gracilibacteria bacterium]
MKNDKILNYMIAFLLALIAFNWLFPTQKDTKQQTQTGIIFKVSSTDYTIPNSPILEIDNNAPDKLTFNTCKNITIYKDSLKVENLPKTFCKDVDIAKNSKATLDVSSISKLFSGTGQFSFKLNVGNKEYSTLFNISEKGFFNNFFSTIFYAPVYNLFVFLISFLPGHNLGLAIILVTLIIRLLILVPQHHILMNSKKMQSIQPKIKEIQTKYKGDQSKIGMELLELYKKEKVNPMGSCLPLLIQFPLLIVLYWVISGITNSANYFYLYGPLQSFDTSKINANFLGLDLIKQEWKSGIILAIIIGLAQFVQIKASLTIHKTTKTKQGEIIKKDEIVDNPVSEFMPDPNVMNAFMLWGMPIMLAFTAYFMPSGVGIYWLIGTLFTLAQQVVVNKITKK